MKIIKMQNVSQATIPVAVKGGPTVYLAPSGVMESVEIENYDEISRFVRADVCLNEPTEAKKVNITGKRTKMYLKD